MAWAGGGNPCQGAGSLKQAGDRVSGPTQASWARALAQGLARLATTQVRLAKG